ncbi:MAG TPA: diaminopimelate decarboxylase [Rhizomicrobium sp.]|nr:diaminopimelate decarboxylase [Rhizomicrobium sp.]
MNAFAYREGSLHAEDVDLATLAQDVGTPLYCYSTSALTHNFVRFRDALPKGALIAYAVKANGNLAVLNTLAQAGAGADVVSGGELKKALAAGIPASRIVFSGVGKTRSEMKAALEAEIHQFNVESEPELEALNDVAISLNARAPIAIRVNPDVSPDTHAKISTGGAETKFGIPWRRARDVYALAAKLPAIEITGIATHIGSQISDLAAFETAFTRLIELAKDLRAQGYAVSRIDFGGGLGVDYRGDAPPDVQAYAQIVSRLTQGLDAQLIFEPGRAIAADAGVLVSRVLYVKQGESRNFLVLDAGMNDLLRPALYDAHHEIVAVADAGSARAVYDIVGPVCETADLFARNRDMPLLKSGDLVAILKTGAYGAAMASAYNMRAIAPEVLVKGAQWAIVRPRINEDELVGYDRLPNWQS